MTLVEGARILSMADEATDGDPSFVGYLLHDEGKIVEVGAGSYQGNHPIERRVDATGMILMPGFVSGHNHLWQSAFRGLASDRELYGWLAALHWTYGDTFSEGDFYAYTRHGALDQLAHGITTTYNHSQRLGATEALYMESLQASLDTPQNFIFSYNANLRQPPDAVRADVASVVKQAESVDAPNLLGVSLHSVGLYFNKASFGLELEIAKTHDLTLQVHYLEEFARRDKDRAQWPIFLELGALSPRLSFAHFIHTSDDILDASAAAGAAMIWNPLSNGRLASGLPDIPDYLARGLGVGMGVDGAASADIADPFENLRMGLYALRMQSRSAAVMSPLRILKLHTIDTARVLGVDHEVGSLAPGKRADYLLVNPAQAATGPIFDAPATLVFSSSAANLHSVVVNGKEEVRRGELLDADLQTLQQEVVERVAAQQQRLQAISAQ
ncbi:MAG: amidohydrolase family protein [Pseudomonadota bacterium]